MSAGWALAAGRMRPSARPRPMATTRALGRSASLRSRGSTTVARLWCFRRSKTTQSQSPLKTKRSKTTQSQSRRRPRQRRLGQPRRHLQVTFAAGARVWDLGSPAERYAPGYAGPGTHICACAAPRALEELRTMALLHRGRRVLRGKTHSIWYMAQTATRRAAADSRHVDQGQTRTADASDLESRST